MPICQPAEAITEGKSGQQQHLERLKVLCDLTRKLSGTMGTIEVLNFIVEAAADLLDLPYTRAFILDGDVLRLRAQHGGMLVNAKNVDFQIDERAGGIAVKSADIFYIKDVRDSPFWKNPRRQIEEGIGSYLAVPLINDESVIGILECMVMGVREFTANDLDLMSTFAAHAAIAIENVRLHEKSQKSQQFFESVVRDNVDAIIISDLDTKVMFWNSGAERLYGFTEDEAIGRKLLELIIPQENRDEVRQLTANVIRGKKSSTYEAIRLKKGGEEVHVSIALSPIRNAGGEVVAVSSIHRDQTQRIETEKRLSRSQKFEAIGQLASGAAHDFNNVLAGISLHTELIKTTAGGNKELLYSIDSITKFVSSGSGTIKRLQDFSRQRDKSPEGFVDLNETIREISEITRPRWKNEAEKRGAAIDLIINRSRDNTIVQGDLGEIQEALLNLIYNAIDALPKGGKITLSTDTLDGEVKVTVADSGIGMTPEVRERVLEPFFTTKAERGTGLGLSMVYGSMERHRGRLTVESAIGEGTRVSLYFPISEGRVEKEIPEEAINSPSSNILIIDDEEDIVDTLAKLLSKSGHRVEGFTDPLKGIECFENQEFDLVFTDLGMSPLTGWDVCGRIKEIRPATPVVLITGWGYDLDDDKLNESGFDKILAKPFDRTSILSIIAEVMQRK